MPALAGDPPRIVAHVFHVGAPGPARRRQLVRQRLYTGRIDTATADGLAVPGHTRQLEIGIDLAIIARLLRTRLAADHRDVIAEAEMRRAVVLTEQRALRRKIA